LETYEKERYVEAPVGLQIVTRRFEDEKCLAVLGVVERAMGRQCWGWWKERGWLVEGAVKQEPQCRCRA
jgi:hypothetical protein